MPLIAWNEKMSVGVPSFDEEHKVLIEMLNSLHDGVRAGTEAEVLGPVLDALVAYTEQHLAHEEWAFARTDFPDAESHRKEHDDLRQQVAAIGQKFGTAPIAALSVEVLNFLKNWLINHIQFSDKKYGAYLTAKGIR